jgi:hypothetical protein
MLAPSRTPSKQRGNFSEVLTGQDEHEVRWPVARVRREVAQHQPLTVGEPGQQLRFRDRAWGDRYFEKVTWPPWTGTSSIQVWPAGTSSLWPPFLVVSLIVELRALPLCQVATTTRPP